LKGYVPAFVLPCRWLNSLPAFCCHTHPLLSPISSILVRLPQLVTRPRSPSDSATLREACRDKQAANMCVVNILPIVYLLLTQKLPIVPIHPSLSAYVLFPFPPTAGDYEPPCASAMLACLDAETHQLAAKSMFYIGCKLP
jgi:hypothetical protein